MTVSISDRPELSTIFQMNRYVPPLVGLKQIFVVSGLSNFLVGKLIFEGIGVGGRNHIADRVSLAQKNCRIIGQFQNGGMYQRVGINAASNTNTEKTRK